MACFRVLLKRSFGEILLDQETYAPKVAGRYGYGKAHATETPLSTGWTAANTYAPGGKDGRAQDLDYPAALGSVGYLAGYLATRTTPWLLYAFGAPSTASAKSELLKRRGLDAAPPGARVALARVLRFVRSSRTSASHSGRHADPCASTQPPTPATLEIHPSSSHCARSRSSGCVSVCAGVVHAFSSVQKATALSTFEAEHLALVLTICFLLAIRRLDAFALGTLLLTSKVASDNESTLKTLAKRDLSARSRHINVHLGFVRVRRHRPWRDHPRIPEYQKKRGRHLSSRRSTPAHSTAHGPSSPISGGYTFQAAQA